LRVTHHIPVLYGSQLPRFGRTDAETERYCRAMLILFKPWRRLADLLTETSWLESYRAYEFTARARRVIDNIHVEDECRDARQRHDEDRRAGTAQPLL
ncbi:hypothetical protein BV25DRAFT_1777397, partial [Artomyces pyxidatus]